MIDVENLKIEYKDISVLIPYQDNSRTHSEDQVKEIIDSIKRRGWTNPILTDGQNGIVAGHGRLLAAQKLGLKRVPTIDLSFASEADKIEYIIEDNKLALNAGWDYGILKLQFDLLEDAGLDLKNTGFHKDELKEIRNVNTFREDLCDEDEVPTVPTVPVSKLGDIWILGNHRLMCGDSTMLDQVEKLMNGEKAEILITSPPYSDMREYSGNDISLDVITSIFKSFYQQANFYVINLGLQYKNHEINPYWNSWVKSATDIGLKLLAWNVWDKIQAGSISNQSQMFALSHEWIFVFGEKPKQLNRIWEKSENSEKRQKYFKVNDKGQKVRSVRQTDGSMDFSSYGRDYESKNMGSVITQFSEQERTINHPAKYPVGLPEPYIESMTNENDIVIDCFGGSGSTLIACEKTNRKCFMMEISPAYISVIIRRYCKFTGKDAILESTGKTFKSLENEKELLAMQ